MKIKRVKHRIYAQRLEVDEFWFNVMNLDAKPKDLYEQLRTRFVEVKTDPSVLFQG